MIRTEYGTAPTFFFFFHAGCCVTEKCELGLGSLPRRLHGAGEPTKRRVAVFRKRIKRDKLVASAGTAPLPQHIHRTFQLFLRHVPMAGSELVEIRQQPAQFNLIHDTVRIRVVALPQRAKHTFRHGFRHFGLLQHPSPALGSPRRGDVLLRRKDRT